MNDFDSSSPSRPTAERILAVARRLFARDGFEGTSVRALTREAGANLGAVTYHFESKEALYHEVLDRVFGPVREGVRSLADAPLPAPQRLELFVRAMFHHQREHMDIPRFMAREVVWGEHPSPQILETVKTVVGSLARIMEEGQEEGSIVPGDPVLMALTLLSQPIYLSLMPRFLLREDLELARLPRPRSSPEEHVLELTRRAFFLSQEDSK